MTRRGVFATITSVAGLWFAAAFFRRMRERQHRDLEELFAYGQGRTRARLHAEGLDPDGMSEDERMDYVNRVVHEYRREKRNEKQF